MTEPIPPTVAVRLPPAARSTVLSRLLRNPLGIVAIAFLVLVIVVAILAPVLSPFDPNYTDLSARFASPSATHPLGADSAGRDILSRLLWGARVTLLAAALAAGVAVLVGVPSGLIAGYYGAWFDGLSSWTTNLLMSLPNIVVLLAVRAAFGPSVWISMSIFGVLLAPSFYRLVRTSVQSVRNELYVDAARVSGLGDGRIIGRHVLFVVRSPIVIQAAFVAGIAISIQSGLEFLGLGDPQVPTWGVMLSEAFRNIFANPQMLIWPGLAISLTVAMLAIFGNALRDALEDRRVVVLRRRKKREAIGERSSELPPSPPSDAVLAVEGLGVAYPLSDGTLKQVVEGVSIDVQRGRVLGIVGESGSGKSQTAFSILGLLPEAAIITDGRISFDGTVITAAGVDDGKALAKLRGKGLAYVPQEPMSNLDPAFTIGHQLVRPMVKILGLSKAEARERVLELLSRVGIVDPVRTFNSYPHEVSGGMAQRVLIAGAVSCEPEVLIADEPTTALDVTIQAEVLDLLRSLQTERRMAMVLVTHNFGVVADICDDVAVMQNGRIVERGPVRDILRDPQHPYTRLLLAATLEGREPRTRLGLDTLEGTRS